MVRFLAREIEDFEVQHRLAIDVKHKQADAVIGVKKSPSGGTDERQQ